MSKPPRHPPSTRKTDAPRDAIAGRSLVAKPADPRQAGLFDEPLPKWIRVSAYVADGKATIRTRNGHDWTARFPAPCLPTLVDKPPVGPQWMHEIKWDGYRSRAPSPH